MANSPVLYKKKAVQSPDKETVQTIPDRRVLRPRLNSTTKAEDTTKITKTAELDRKNTPSTSEGSNTKESKDTPRHGTEVKATNITNQVVDQQTNTLQSKDIQTPKMESQKIQQLIASFVPEFNGDNRMNELDRFVRAADATYETLTNEDDKKTFTRLVQFRLAGDAYNRMRNMNTRDYKTFTTTLVNMYGTTETLEDRENQFVNTQQAYGESVRSYGYRIAEELAKYKTAYLQKYQIPNIDKTYEKHLDTTAITIFKRGLNNIIIKEKIATQKAETLEDIVHDTEVTEKMLLSTKTTPLQQTLLTPSNDSQQSTQPNINKQIQPTSFRRPPIICHYCQKPGHTWAICRNRLNNERQPSANKQQSQYYNSNQYTQSRQPYSTPNPRFTNHYQAEQQNQAPARTTYQSQKASNNFTPQNQHNGSGNYNRYNQQPNYNNYRQQSNQPNFTNPKYCSHCKTTVGHTFEECRSKLRDSRNYNPNQQPTHTTNLENQFEKLRINNLSQQHPEPNNNQGNETGSNQ